MKLKNLPTLLVPLSVCKSKISFFITLLSLLMTACSGSDDGWDDPVIPLTLKGIEAVNIDNAGEFPLVASSPIKKEAYMLGVKWVTSNVPDDDDDKFITDPIQQGEQTYNVIASDYSKAIKCNTQFNADIPAGKYVSKFFKEVAREYLPADVNEGFALLVAPDPGIHSFTIEYYLDEELKFSYETSLIEFF
ncbi:DUF5034 domain-containing protein [Bacteroides sp. 214]|uniref:DUF5034 domain-containing protein n=1 Tax=Bacteroides sp. 214 TaxID=2302935 RepID=UPI0013D887CE|nr:DUF5034 domain-containing protein [Bacteroides sp. 214]NDW12897.1 DUF5034 domain-containing protein [Bacteroides sp. 214]